MGYNGSDIEKIKKEISENRFSEIIFEFDCLNILPLSSLEKIIVILRDTHPSIEWDWTGRTAGGYEIYLGDIEMLFDKIKFDVNNSDRFIEVLDILSDHSECDYTGLSVEIK